MYFISKSMPFLSKEFTACSISLLLKDVRTFSIVPCACSCGTRGGEQRENRPSRTEPGTRVGKVLRGARGKRLPGRFRERTQGENTSRNRSAAQQQRRPRPAPAVPPAPLTFPAGLRPLPAALRSAASSARSASPLRPRVKDSTAPRDGPEPHARSDTGAAHQIPTGRDRGHGGSA